MSSSRNAAGRRRVVVVSAAVVAGLVAVTAVVIAARQSGGAPDSAPASATAPRNLTDGAIAVGEGPVTVTVYEDLQCPACRRFEATTGPLLDELAASGDIRLERRVIAFLDRASADRYSTRAANAVACVVDSAPAAVGPFVSALFERQPAEGGAGLSDDELAQIATVSGADGVGTCIADEQFARWVRSVTEQALSGPVTGTPTVLVDGTPVSDLSPEAVRAAVDAARA